MYNEYIAKQFNNYLMSKCRVVTGAESRQICLWVTGKRSQNGRSVSTGE